MPFIHRPSRPQFEFANVAELTAYLNLADAHDRCSHARQWTNCWVCGYNDDYNNGIEPGNITAR